MITVQKRNRKMTYLKSILAILMMSATTGCDDGPKIPELGIYDINNIQSIEDTFDCQNPAVTDLTEGEIVFATHILPEDAVPVGALKVTVETPCGDPMKLEGRHVDSQDLTDGKIKDRKLAIVPFSVPQGGQCALKVTASMANSKLSCFYSPKADALPPECTSGALCENDTDESSDADAGL